MGKTQNEETKNERDMGPSFSSQQEENAEYGTHLNFNSTFSNEVFSFDHHVLEQILFFKRSIVITDALSFHIRVINRTDSSLVNSRTQVISYYGKNLINHDPGLIVVGFPCVVLKCIQNVSSICNREPKAS